MKKKLLNQKTLSQFLFSLGLFLLCVNLGWGQNPAIAVDVANNGDYRSLASGNWSAAATWQVRTSGSWATATLAPTATNTVYIQALHTVTLTGESDCYSLHIENTGKLAAGANTVNVYGKLRCYILAAAVTGATSDAYLGTDAVPTIAAMLTSTAVPTLRFRGVTRAFNFSNEWNAGVIIISADIVLADAAQTITSGAALRFSNLTLTTGNLTSGNPHVITGNCTIKTGTKFITSQTGVGNPVSIGNFYTSPAGTLDIQTGGTLEFRTASPDINFATFINNGTVIYSTVAVPVPGFFMTNANGSAVPDVNTYNNLIITNTAGVTLSGSTTVNGILTLTAGTLTTGANTVTIASTGSVSRTSGWVNGNLKRAIASGANTYLYPLGNATKYTPASLAFTSAGGGDLTGSTVDGVSSSYPVALDAVKKLGRSWNFTTAGIGTFNADITFNYDATDLLGGATSGTITAYKYVSPSTYSYPTTTTGTNSFIATGITGFGEFGAGECGAVTPTFTQVNGICSGGSLSALPTTSNNSITGTWSPALNNTATTLYTFTPTASSCAPTATMTITVNTIPATPLICQLQPFWRSQPVLGPYLQDGISTIEIPNYMLQTDFPYQKRSFATEVPFADNLSVVRLLGGYSKYPGIAGTLTDLTTPAGIALLNQLRAYDFVYRNTDGTLAFRPELIQQRLQPYLDLGYEDLTLVLDNIPWDLTTNTTNASLNSYGNKGVPNSSQEWYDTVSQLCTTLETLLGEVKANKLRFRIGTEMNGLERFHGTEAQFITHYDHAAAAIQSVLPGATLSLYNISSATLSNIDGVHNVGAFRVLNHIANENNQKTGARLTKIPNFVSLSKYFYEDNDLTTVVSTSDDVWDHVKNNITGYQNNFSREIHEFGGLADWTANPTTANEGAFGGAMTLQVFMKYMEVGVDRIYHWDSFKSIPNGPVRYQIPTSQAWMYSVLEYLSGGAVYKMIPDTPTIPRVATVTSMLSVKNGKSYLLVNSFDPDKTNTTVSEVILRIPKSYLSSISLASTKMASLTNANCVLNEIRRDVELAGNLNPLLASNYIPSNFQDLCVDYTAFKAMVLANATRYENLWKQSLTLTSVGGNITEEGTNFVVKLNMAASQNSVIVLQGPLPPTGTLTANPTTVTTFPNVNNTGNTALTMTSLNAAKVIVTHQSTGSTTSAEAIVINNTDLSFSNLAVNYIKEGATHTFRLYATEEGSSVLGALLATVIVNGQGSRTSDVATDGDYRSLTSGNWSAAGTWQVRAAGVWATATVAPTATNTVYIQATHTVTLTGESNCYSLHIATTGKLAAGANTVNIYGKLRCYVLAAAVTGASDLYIGTDITDTAMVTEMITFTAGSTTLKFKGLARILVQVNEWSISTSAPAISAEFALDAGLAGNLNNGVRFSNLTLSSGDYFMGNIANVITGDFIIKNGAKFQTQATGTTAGSIGNIAGTPAGKLEIEEGGTLAFRTAAPTINFTNFVNNGTVMYLLSAPMSFMTNANGSSTPDVNTYNNITISNLNNNPTGTTLTATSTILIKGILNIVNLTSTGTSSTSTLNANGLVTLKSTATKTATVGTIETGVGVINGDVIVERYIPAKRAWRALTAPVIRASNNSIYSNWQNAGTSGILTSTGVEIWSNASPLTTVTSGGSGSSMLSYSSSGNSWSGITDTTNTPLFSSTINNPFMVFVTGPYGSANITDASSAATTLRATGSLLIGNQTYSSAATKYTFIGNPYASPLNLKSMLDDTDNDAFDNYIWIWQAIGSGNVGVYNTYDPAASGAYTNATNPNGIDATTQIQSGQAFFVKSTNAATFTIKEIHKGSSISPASIVFRDAAPAQLLRVGLYKQTNTEWSGRDGAMTVILNDADANQTPNKMANGTENVAFTKNSGLFASNHHLPLLASDILNVKVWNTAAGANYKLKINTEQFTTTNLNATLEDLFTNSRTPLTLDGSAVEYPFAVTTEALSAGNRFRIVFENAALGINNPKGTGISILPNPITGDVFQVNFGTLGMGTYSYSICNALGQEVEKGNINNVAQNTNSVVKFKNNTAAGLYIMKVTGSDNTVFTAKIIKK